MAVSIKLERWITAFQNMKCRQRKIEALGCYWDDYYAKAFELQTAYSESFRIFATDSLNTEEGQRAILWFVGLRSEEMRVKLPLHFHQSKSTDNRLISRVRKLPLTIHKTLSMGFSKR